MVQNGGDEAIPFSAIKVYEYKAFVTHIRTDADLEVIRRHVSTKLRSKVTLTLVSKQGAPFLSLRVHCISERDDLDLKMPGLWPDSTFIYKWRSKIPSRRPGNGNRATNSPDQSSRQNSATDSQTNR